MSKSPTIRDLQGNVITVKDLPPITTVRWTANKKAIVVRAVLHKLIPLEDVLRLYCMTEQEFEFWAEGLIKYGVVGLKVTYFQKRAKN